MMQSIRYACQCQSQLSCHVLAHVSLLKKNSSRAFVDMMHRRNFILLTHFHSHNHNTQTYRINYIRFKDEYRSYFGYQKRCVDKLTELLQCEEEEVKRLVLNEHKLFAKDTEVIERKVNLLLAAHVPPDVIRKNFWVLCVSLTRLETYLREMKRWNIEKYHFHEFLPVLKKTPSTFAHISERFLMDNDTFPCGNRVLYLAEKLNCSVSTILSEVIESIRLMQKSFKEFEEILCLFKEFGVKKEDVLNNLCCLGSHPETLRKKLQNLNKRGLSSAKLWLAKFRSPKVEEDSLVVEEFGRFNSYEKFLSAKLGIDILLVQKIRRSYPYVFKIHPSKFMIKLQFFLNAGYTIQELLPYPHVFYFNVDTLNDRIAILQKTGIEKPWVSALARNNQDFLQYVKSLKTRDLNEAEKHSAVEEEAAQYNSYLVFLATKFNVDEEVMIKREDSILRKYPFFFRMRPLTFIRKLEFFVNAGYKSEELLDHLYIFSNNISTMKSRLIRLQELGVQKPFLSVLGKSSPKFEQYVNSLSSRVRNNAFEKHHQVIKEAKHYESYEEFVAAKLQVDKSCIIGRKDEIQSKYPYFFKMQPLKFAEKSEFFLNAGYTSEELLNYPRIFTFKLDTVNIRLVYLQKLGIKKPRLSILGKSNFDFAQFVSSKLAGSKLETCETLSR